MKNVLTMTLAILLSISIAESAGAQMAYSRSPIIPDYGYDRSLANKIANCDKILEEFLASEGLPADLVENAKAIIVFSNAVRAGFVVSGQFGQGIALFRDDSGHWSAPSFFRISGMGVGLQAGGEVADHIMVVRTKEGVEALLKHRFTLGVDIDATAGPVGRNLDASTNTKTGILTYGRTKGLYAGVSMDGVVIKQDAEANEKYYGRKLDAKEILMDHKAFITEPAAEVIKTLNKQIE